MSQIPVSMPFHRAAAEFLRHVQGEAEKEATYLRILCSFTSLKQFFGRRPVSLIDELAIERYKAARKLVVKPGTVRKDLMALERFLLYCMRRRWCRKNAMKGVKKPSAHWTSARIRVLTPAEEKRYLTAAQKVSQALYLQAKLMLATGMRPSEILALRLEDIDQARRSVRVNEGKTPSARRSLRLADPVAELVLRLARGRDPKEFLLPGLREGQGRTKLNNPHVRACRMIGFRFRQYDLRHTFATRLAERGVPLPTLAAILGHAGLRCVMVYVHPSQTAMDEALLRCG